MTFLLMQLNKDQIRDLEVAIADKIYIKVANWNLYLGDAGLAQELAIECIAYLPEGSSKAAKKACDSLKVKLGGGNTLIALSQLISSSQLFELEEILDPYCR